MKNVSAAAKKRFWRSRTAGQFAGDMVSSELLRRVRPYMGNRVVDLGAGSGKLVSLIPGSIGLDLVDRPQVNVQKGDILNLGFKDASFDTVIMSEVLEHISEEDTPRAISEVYRVLDRGGHLILTTPYNEDLKANLIVCPDCNSRFHVRLHLQSFTEDNIKRVLERNRFRIVRTEKALLYFTSKWPKLRFLEFWLRRYLDGNLLCIARKSG